MRGAHPLPSSLPLRIYNKQPPNEAVAASAEKAKNVDILMPSPVQPLPEPRVSCLRSFEFGALCFYATTVSFAGVAD